LSLKSGVEAVLEKIRNSLVAKQEVSRSLQAASRIYNKRMQALELFHPFAYQDEFLFCQASEVLIRGGTRSGKSTVVAAGIASYALNRPVMSSVGIPINMRPPEYADNAVGEIWIIGKQMNHSSTIYRLLFEPGAFRILRDPKTGLWRAWQPGFIPGDEKIAATELKLSPPFIYPGDVVFGWEKKNEKQWNTATLPNGWVIKYFPSNGEPKRGDPVHRIWIDEDIENDELYPELQSRLSDFKGRIWWSSWPELNCAPLVSLYDRAVDEMADLAAGRIKKPDVYQMSFIGSANPVIDEDEKRKRTKGWDENTRLARDAGEFVRATRLTYPEFDKNYHRVDYGEDDPRNDELTRIMRANNFIPPSDWCVDLVLDPGTIRPAIGFFAIPPEYLWYHGKPYYVMYREVTGRYDAAQLAHIVKEIDPNRMYNRFIIDHKCGDQTSPGDAKRISWKYSEAFKAAGLTCDQTVDQFTASEHNWMIRSMALRRMMVPIAEGVPRPQLRIVTHMCPELIRQIGRNMRQITKDDVQDKKATGQVQDLLDTLEYYAGSRPEYKIPRTMAPPETPSYKSFLGEQERWMQLTGGSQQAKQSVVCGAP